MLARLFTLLSMLLAASPAAAYVGPGMGGGLIAAVIGVVLSLFVAIAGIVYFPLKRRFAQKKTAAETEEQGKAVSSGKNDAEEDGQAATQERKPDK